MNAPRVLVTGSRGKVGRALMRRLGETFELYELDKAAEPGPRAFRADVKFGIYFGVSDNRGRYWDIGDARRDFGYAPKDDAFADRATT